jgi:hypothetical protein
VLGEGQTEFYCLPKIAGRLGHVVVHKAWIRPVSTEFDWERFFLLRVVPLVTAALLKSPDKIIIVIDREDRPQCSVELAQRGLQEIVRCCGHCLGQCSIHVVVANRTFESLLFADYAAVDSLPILRQAISHTFPNSCEGVKVIHWLNASMRPGYSYDKIRDGMTLAKTMRLSDAGVQARSRSLRKLVKELT